MEQTVTTSGSEDATAPSGSSSPWRGFSRGQWQNAIDVRDFVQQNYTPYEGRDNFLVGPTKRTERLWEQEKAAGGVLDADTKVVGKVDSHGAGYINQVVKSPKLGRVVRQSRRG